MRRVRAKVEGARAGRRMGACGVWGTSAEVAEEAEEAGEEQV